MDTRNAARRWARVWREAWPVHDVEAIVALYAPDCLYRSHPFREPTTPRAYLDWAFGDERPGAETIYPEPLVDGDRAAAEWHALTEDASGRHRLAGVSLLRFDTAGLVVEQRDHWAIQDV